MKVRPRPSLPLELAGRLHWRAPWETASYRAAVSSLGTAGALSGAPIAFVWFCCRGHGPLDARGGRDGRCSGC